MQPIFSDFDSNLDILGKHIMWYAGLVNLLKWNT